ncbi:MAG: DNA recombination protein RmuC, partial [Actinomycetota bacterium]
SIRRLETVLAGGASRGRAGENLLHDALSLLPPGMVVTDFRVNGKVVEFALALPDGSHLPVDVKWTAVHELEALEKTEDPEEQNARARDVEDKVARRAREVASYIEPPLTTPFAVACVPDAAYNICKKAHVDAYHRGVFIVPYSSAVPTVLCLHLLASRFGGAGDARTALAEIGTILSDMGNTWEHKVVKATTMLQNAAEEWRGHLGKASGAVARGRGVGGVGGEVVDLTDGSRPSLEVVESPEPVA